MHFYSDTLYVSAAGHRFRLWRWETNKPDFIELENEATGTSKRYTQQQMEEMVKANKLTLKL